MPEIPWRSVAAVQGLTDDGRWLQAIDWRTDLPLSMTAHHDDHIVTGRVDAFQKFGRVVMASGVFIDTPDGQAHAELLRSGAMRWMSAEWVGDWEMLCTRYEDQGYGPECVEALAVCPQATIVKVSQVGAGAFEAAVMELVAEGEAAFDTAAVGRMVAEAETRIPPEPSLPAVVAHAWAAPTEVAPPIEPPLAWFEVPEPDELVPLHIEPNGQVLGHIAAEGTCHIGIQGRCQTPPPSRAAYAYFNLGTIVCRDADGNAVPIRAGNVTMIGGHADIRLGYRDAIAHYDDVGTQVAHVRAVDGVYGVWCCGAAVPSITPDQVRTFNASPPSGDWRPINGIREMIGVHLVNTPGFPVVPLAAAGAMVEVDGHVHEEEGAMVLGLPSWASWQVRRPTELAELRRDVADLRTLVAAFIAADGDRILDSIIASVR
jgi:hypothetical protein